MTTRSWTAKKRGANWRRIGDVRVCCARGEGERVFLKRLTQLPPTLVSRTLVTSTNTPRRRPSCARERENSRTRLTLPRLYATNTRAILCTWPFFLFSKAGCATGSRALCQYSPFARKESVLRSWPESCSTSSRTARTAYRNEPSSRSSACRRRTIFSGSSPWLCCSLCYRGKNSRRYRPSVLVRRGLSVRHIVALDIDHAEKLQHVSRNL